ncbi:MarR family winged helix-turn-helix transcriptional regulator [Gaoshiqia sp. Z1-71]|uniref:MarR family winged helix-turn-helix transcriptional regulator n=1 Tax=Gaoshiqia hydrogeniformans TaxID=3290090 RepID=UPI003BF7FC9F
MTNKYAILKQVLDLYEDYELEETQLSLLDFSHWMIQKLTDEPELDQKVKPEKYPGQQNFPSTLFRQFNEKARFLESVSRIARYHEFYTRKALKDLVINTRLEFLFMQSVQLMEKAKKTDLINLYNLEYTTGMDTIRRLINNELLDEVQDESDKRAKLLALTPKGEETLLQAKKNMAEENVLFFAAISDNKWKKILPVLEEIDDFHGSIYKNHGSKPFAELANLMDSLKHLYK